MRQMTPLIPCLLVLGSCSAPPKPPTVDESQRRPANTQREMDLQRCTAELHNSQLRASESQRLTEAAAAALAQLNGLKLAPSPRANAVFSVRFGFNSTRVELPADQQATLLAEARLAPLVLLRGRTDGQADTPGESRIAKARAAAVRETLVAGCVDPARIRTTYQPEGDHVAENRSEAGRALNRRVEIELYRALPVALAPPQAQP